MEHPSRGGIAPPSDAQVVIDTDGTSIAGQAVVATGTLISPRAVGPVWSFTLTRKVGVVPQPAIAIVGIQLPCGASTTLTVSKDATGNAAWFQNGVALTQYMDTNPPSRNWPSAIARPSANHGTNYGYLLPGSTTWTYEDFANFFSSVAITIRHP